MSGIIRMSWYDFLEHVNKAIKDHVFDPKGEAFEDPDGLFRLIIQGAITKHYRIQPREHIKLDRRSRSRKRVYLFAYDMSGGKIAYSPVSKKEMNGFFQGRISMTFKLELDIPPADESFIAAHLPNFANPALVEAAVAQMLRVYGLGDEAADDLKTLIFLSEVVSSDLGDVQLSVLSQESIGQYLFDILRGIYAFREEVRYESEFGQRTFNIYELLIIIYGYQNFQRRE